MVPTVRPLTTPDVLTEPIAGLVELHTPPVITSLTAVTVPVQTVLDPKSVPAFGEAFTVTVAVAVQPPLVV